MLIAFLGFAAGVVVAALWSGLLGGDGARGTRQDHSDQDVVEARLDEILRGIQKTQALITSAARSIERTQAQTAGDERERTRGTDQPLSAPEASASKWDETIRVAELQEVARQVAAYRADQKFILKQAEREQAEREQGNVPAGGVYTPQAIAKAKELLSELDKVRSLDDLAKLRVRFGLLK